VALLSSFSSADNPLISERIGAANNFLAFAKAKLAWPVPREGHLDIYNWCRGQDLYNLLERQQGWETDHNWSLIDQEGHQIENPASGGLVVLNRVNNQLRFSLAAAKTKSGKHGGLDLADSNPTRVRSCMPSSAWWHRGSPKTVSPLPEN
jgi:hypothetical protein